MRKTTAYIECFGSDGKHYTLLKIRTSIEVQRHVGQTFSPGTIQWRLEDGRMVVPSGGEEEFEICDTGVLLFAGPPPLIG